MLSTPHILATDNEEASISVGENVPIQRGVNPMGALLGGAARRSGARGAQPLGPLGGLGNFGFDGVSVGRQDVGLTLEITPHIKDNNQVRLEMKIEVSEVKSAGSTLIPNISKQNVTTESTVDDQQTVVIGGLMTDKQIETTQKIPILGDIPVIGVVF